MATRLGLSASSRGRRLWGGTRGRGAGDMFKSINGTRGHQAGDVCIQQVAEVMRRKTRKGDWLARWGGDEFVMVMWDASVFASAEMVFGRINADLAQSPI